MNSSFVVAMARATAATRASNPLEATRIITEALRAPADQRHPTSVPGVPEPRPGPRFDPEAEIVEPEADRSVSAATGADERRPEGSAPADHSGAWLGRRIRRPLREVVRALRSGRLAHGLRSPSHMPVPGVAPVQIAVAPGARFEERHHGSAAGARAFKLYLPATESPTGLVLMLHGCKQTPDDFAAGTRMNTVAEEHGLIVVYPRQTNADNLSGCWNWFRPGDQTRDTGEPAILADLTRAVMAEFGVPADRVFVAGLSAGGAMAAVLAETHPDLFAAVGIHSGIPTGAANDLVSAFAAMRGDLPATTGTPPIRRIIFQGEADRTVHPANASRLFGEAKARREEQGRTADGRRYVRTIVENGDGGPETELWMIENAGHAWSGGHASGSYTDPSGPDASAEMARFFLGRQT